MADANSGSGGNNGWMAAAMSGLVSAGSAITKGGPKRQYKYNKKLAEDQNSMNRENASWILEQNRQLSEEQREYDSPAAQMARYKAAGLNPNLIYGQGSAGNMGSPVQANPLPGVQMGNVEASYPDLAGTFMGAQMMQSQMGLTQAKTIESGAKTQVAVISAEIAKTNPMLNPEVAQMVGDAMLQSATAKAQEQFIMHSEQPDGNSNIAKKVHMEIEAMAQRLGLNTADLAIKNKILESKEFQNAILEVQKKFMTDKEITPEHIRQGFMLILSKMLGR